jgi:acetaldehyde dehydrogenase/alcohol dehydrogenase
MTTKEAKMNERISAQEEVNQLVARAKEAQQQFLKLDQDQVDHVIQQMALAGIDRHMVLAKLAVEETGRGVY